MKQIIQDFTDTDFYKFTAGQVAYHQFPKKMARYAYTNRLKDKTYPAGFADKINEQIEMMTNLQLSNEVRNFLSVSAPWLKEDYLDYLQKYRYNPAQVTVSQDNEEIQVNIEGLWHEVILWEVPLLCIITELSHQGMDKIDGWRTRIIEKANKLSTAGVNWIDFGTRRRFDFETQETVNQIMCSYKPNYRGTSNPYLAYKFNIKPMGTYGHEVVMGLQADYGVLGCNLAAMQAWAREYQGRLGIALSDTVTTKKFLEDFDGIYARLFDGVRQDSGDPFEIGEMVIKHYENLGIDPTTKILIFSDSLNTDLAIELNKRFGSRIRVTMGIGTHLTNDVGHKPSNHVIKMTQSTDKEGNWVDAIKVSDDKGKSMGYSLQKALKELGINV
jgi:nicotinate phosphoribosyltransferase